VTQTFDLVTWCPRTVKEKTGLNFGLRDPRQGLATEPLMEAINNPDFRGSFKLNFFEKESIVP
jgi:hypothetical protein